MANSEKSPKQNKSEIAEELWPILFLLKCLGNCPLVKQRIEIQSISKSSRDTEIPEATAKAIVYQFYPKISFGIVFHVILNFIFITVNILYVVNVIFRKPFIATSLQDYKNFPSFIRPKNDSECINGYNTSQIELLEILFGRVGALLYQLVAFMELVFSWWTAKDFARFVNNWQFFRQNYEQQFHPYPNNAWHNIARNLRRFKKKLFIIYTAIPALFFIPVFALTSISYLHWANVAFLISSTVQIIPRSLLEDVKMLFSYKILQLFYIEIQKDIAVVVERDKGKVQAETIKAWGDLLDSIQNQSTLLLRTQSTMQLTLVAFSTVSTTIFIFLAVNSKAIENDENKIYFLCLAVGFPIISIARLYFKIISAEKLTMELIARGQLLDEGLKNCVFNFQEQNLGLFLSNVNFGFDLSDIPVKMQISEILSRIRHNPIKISFWNYVTLNKQLLLKILGQILTYIIVLMQVQTSFAGGCKY
ncbi:unnamed protein product [Allacma fusca]|uniref:Uncharacterized protein n=1 Tax=Allacma fusca TaxID=39272 RepID=A0A8J2JN89_9HEXA|nr:unnamed protein product [Allacma fusca]